MAEDKTKKPSADEILDDLAEEMGIDEASDVDVDEEEAVDDLQDDEGEEEAQEVDSLAALDGVFAVKKGKKKKKKKSTEKKERPKKENALSAEVGGLFKPEEDGLDLEDIELDDEFSTSSPMNKGLIGIIVALVVALGAVLFFTTNVFDDLVLMMQGNYQEEMARRVAQEEREHMEAQMAGMPRFGALAISGRPQHARIRLNGQIQYGQTSEGQWRELRVTPQTLIQDISIDTTHTIEVEAPGHEVRSFTVVQDMWERRPPDYFFQISATLTPESPDHFTEFTQRMEGDQGTVYLGTVDFRTVPEGAQIVVNSRVALDENGEELRTPVRTDVYFTFDEEEEKLVERDFRVDMPANRGNRIELIFPDDEEMPEFVMALNRSMWTCEWKDDAERSRIPASAPILRHCNYVYNLHLDFEELKAYIAEREAERERIEQERRDARGGAPAPEAAEANEG